MRFAISPRGFRALQGAGIVLPAATLRLLVTASGF